MSIWSGSNENKVVGVVVLINDPQLQLFSYREIIGKRVLQVIREKKRFRILNIYALTEWEICCSLLEELTVVLPGALPLILIGDVSFILEVEDKMGEMPQY